MILKTKDLTPIFVLGGFNLITIFLLIVSPFKYVYGDYISSFLYVLMNIFFIFFGYLSAVSILNNKNYRNLKIYDFKGEVRLFKFLLLFFLFTFLFRYSYILRYQFYDIPSIINDIAIGVANPKFGYISMIENTRSFTLPWSLYVFVTIFHTLFFITGFVVWNKISWSYRVFFSVTIIFECVFWYSRGTNFGIISLLIILLLAYLLRLKKLNLKAILSILVIFILAAVVFSSVMYSRLGEITDLSKYEIYLTTINYDSYILRITPDALKPTLLTFFSYFTQGYYFLSFGFDLDYRFSYFLASNPTLMSIAEILGVDYVNNSMVHRLSQYGIDPGVQWHSAYLWVASDFSFYFVPLYIFVLSFILGASWIFAVKYDDYVFKIIFIIVGGSIFFLFANNNFISLYFYLLVFMCFLALLKLYFHSKISF